MESIRPAKRIRKKDKAVNFNTTTIVEEVVEKITIEPRITELNAAGKLSINFEPPYAKVPASWDAIWDPVKKEAMTQK